MVRGFRSSDKMHFSYHVDWVEEKGKKVPIHRPRIEIVLRKRSEKADPETNPEFRTYGLIDSGADICFLPRVIANVLKLDLKEETKKESTSASGKFSTYRTETHSIKTEVGGADEYWLCYDHKEKPYKCRVAKWNKDRFLFTKYGKVYNKLRKYIFPRYISWKQGELDDFDSFQKFINASHA